MAVGEVEEVEVVVVEQEQWCFQIIQLRLIGIGLTVRYKCVRIYLNARSLSLSNALAWLSALCNGRTNDTLYQCRQLPLSIFMLTLFFLFLLPLLRPY